MKGTSFQIFIRSAMVAVLIPISKVVVQAQDATVLWINVYGTPPAYAHMTFGNRIGNTTSGIDTQASFPSEYREQEPCGPVPGFDAVWGSVRGATQFGSGIRGLCDRQINAWTSEAQWDTFRINFAQQDNVDQDISFKWPDAIYIALRCDSLMMVYFNPNVGTNVRLNMMTTDTLVIPAAGTNGVSFVRIFKHGAKLVDTELNDENPLIPANFSLLQNFPNPFNPETKIQYAVSSRQYVSIKIYDVLGRDVATLVKGVQDPGFKSVTWDASAVSSGIYFYRIQAGTFTETKKMLLMR